MSRHTRLESCAVVRSAAGNQFSYARCTIDEFTAGCLTVSSVDTGDELRTFVAGSWKDAVAYDARGNVLVAFTAEQEAGNV